MAAIINDGQELLWVDGVPVLGLTTHLTRNQIGEELYWTDGTPELTLPNKDVAKFINIFL